MERQLKERLTGAAVLILIAVILVPEMFSGPASRSVDSADAVNTAQVKTYQVELEPHSQASVPVEPVEVDVVSEVETRVQLSEQAYSSAMSESAASVAAQASSSSASSSSSMATVSTSSVSSVSSQRSAVKTSASSSAKSASAAPKKASPNGKWVVQVGSFSTKQRAQEVISKLNGLGMKANVASITSGNKVLYRVRSTPMADRATAATALKKVNAAFPGASVVSIN